MIRNSESGYSLVELLVVLALLGLIMVAISGGISFGARVWERTQATADSSDRVRGTQGFLRALVGRVYPRERDPNAADEEAAFVGDAKRLSFLSLAPDGVGDGAVVRVELNVEASAGAFELRMKRATDEGAEQTRTLLSSARSIAFTFGTTQPNGDIAWVDAWDAKAGVPTLVRIRATFDNHANKVWPDLIIHPMIDRDAACIYDPVSFNCRHG